MSWPGDPSLAVLVAALLVDVALGEPPRWLHPVVWIGRVARRLVRWAPAGQPGRELAVGAVIAVGVPAGFAVAALLVAMAPVGPVLGFVLATWLLTSTFAARGLGAAARGVRDPLGRGDVDGARRGLRSLCSRDPGALDGRQLAAGAVESVAENASDSVVAPLFYYALFGLPGAIAYRAINTLDALIGYRGRYEYLGKSAARLDDVANLVPARLTAALLLGVAAVCGGGDVRRGWAVLRRDAGRTASPNAGWPMAAMAGLLGVELDKPGHYRLGDPVQPLGWTTIDAAWRLVARVFVAAALLCGAAIALR